MCFMTEEQHGKLLCVHHIDYYKDNLNYDNLISLCKYCHGKLHGNKESRQKWKKELSNLLKSKMNSQNMFITLG